MSDKVAVPDIHPIMPTYNRFPLAIVKGKGSYVWDDNGEKYLDYTSGIATCNLGHVPQVVKEKVEAQLQELWHCSNLYHIPVQQQLAEVLTKNSVLDQAFFCNSGAEANEAAIKMARRYAQQVKGTDAFEVVTFTSSFHGRTLGTLAATGQEKIQEGFAPLLEGFRHLPYNDVDALDQLVQPKTCAVLLELVQGEGGVIPADPVWVEQIAKLCKENDLLLMIDEVQTGMGRTGTLFAYEQYDIDPDVVSLAKGLGSGFPIGALLAKAEAAQAFIPGTHGSTFGGNPLAASAGFATVSHLVESNVLTSVVELGEYLVKQLHQLKEQFISIDAIRGKGLLLGLAIKGKPIEIITKAREQNVLILPAGGNVVRVLPPLTTTKEEIDQFVSVLKKVFEMIDEG